MPFFQAQMRIDRNRNFILTLEEGRLSVVDIVTLRVFHQQEYPAGCAMACSEEYVFVGTGSGDLVALNLFDLNETLVCSMGSPVLSVFYLDGFIYCGSEEGTIYVYSIVDCRKHVRDDAAGMFLSSLGSDPADMSSEEDGALFRHARSVRHGAPVAQICANGVEMFVADMRNKITVYPSRRMYDMRSPSLRYKNYVFSSERNMIYCKTKTAFGVYVTVKSSINDYKFSRNGGIVFVQCGGVVYVVDFNERSVVKEVRIEGGFVYDDDRNRIVRVNGNDFTSIEDVLDREYEEMGNVEFREDGIVEKRTGMLEDSDEDVVSRYVECGSKREGLKKYVRNGGMSSVRTFGGSGRETDGAGDRGIESSDEEDGQGMETEATSRTLVQRTEDGSLLCYNLEGYMVSLRHGNASKIEVNYHDVGHRKIEVVDSNNCTTGAFSGNNIVVGNRAKVLFISPACRWEKDMEANHLCITRKMVVVVSDDVKVFGVDGEEMFNCLIPEIHHVCCHDGVIAVFSRELILIDLFKSTERFLLPSRVSFACFDEGGRLFYKIGNGIYNLYRGLSVKVCEAPMQPLGIFNNHVISLASSHKLLPHPHVDHTRLSDGVIRNLLDDGGMDSDHIEMADVDSEPTSDEMPRKCGGTGGSSDAQHPTRRYNPFNK